MVARKLGCTFVLSLLSMALGCERRPAADIVVKVARDGRASVGGRKLSVEKLGKLLRERTEASPRDPDGLPIFTVEVSAHPECEYQHVQRLMMQCWKRYVWRVRWEMGGRRLDADLRKSNDHHIIYEEHVASPPLSFREPPSAAHGAARLAELARLRTQATHQLRIMLCWVNKNDQVIHSVSEPFPDDRPSLCEPVSTMGAHITISTKTVEVSSREDVRVNTAQLSGLDALVRTLGDFAARDPDAYVVIDARRAVPFRWVFDTLDACKRAKVRGVFFEHLRMEGARGNDWFWM